MGPPITVVVTTYLPSGVDGALRLEAFHKAAWSWLRGLRYEGPLRMHIADDGSRPAIIAPPAIAARFGPVTYSYQSRRGVGASLNAGFRRAFEVGPLVLYAVDDWSLRVPLDLTPWAQLLLDDSTYGCIRLGVPHPFLTGRVAHVPSSGEFMFVPDRQGFAFAHRPALYHRRFIEHYGEFAEGVNALECERLYSDRYCSDPSGPLVAVAFVHPWRHIPSVELSSLDPSGG